MANHPVQTDVIAAIDRQGRIVAELDGTDPSKAARQFSRAWRNGLLDRVQDDNAPLMDKSELQAVTKHAWRSEDGVRFVRVYMSGTERVYPEGISEPRTTMADKVSRAIDQHAHRAWTKGMQRIENATKATRQTLAVDRADEYVRGLEEVRRLDAMGQLKSAIDHMADPVAKREMKERYPELFSDVEVSRMAQEKDAADRDARIEQWEKSRASEV